MREILGRVSIGPKNSVLFTVKPLQNMVDKLKMATYGQRLHPDAIDLLDNPKTYPAKDGAGEWKIGNLKNLRISHNTSSTRTIVEGSLAKFWKGDNVHPLTIAEHRAAIECLSDTLHIDLRLAQILCELEIAGTINTLLPPAQYFPYIGTPAKYIRKPFVYPNGNQTLYLECKSQEIKLYDKAAESGLTADPGPYWLRYEVVLKEGLTRQLKLTNPLKAEDLYNPAIYQYLARWWAARFARLPMLPDVAPMPIVPPGSTAGDIEQLMFCHSASTGVAQHILAQVAQHRQRGQMDRQNAKRLKDKLKGCKDWTPPAEILQDLTARIQAAAIEYVSL